MATLHLENKEDTTPRENIFPIIVASTLGSAIEWSDFFYYSFLAVTVFPVVFFPRLDPSAGIVASFTANFVGFVARPLGGVFFGRFGDRVGRKSTLVATLLLIGTTTMLMGVLPSYASLGITAPLLLAILRFLQGVGVGGEWGGSVLLTMEFSDQRRRGEPQFRRGSGEHSSRKDQYDSEPGFQPQSVDSGAICELHRHGFTLGRNRDRAVFNRWQSGGIARDSERWCRVIHRPHPECGPTQCDGYLQRRQQLRGQYLQHSVADGAKPTGRRLQHLGFACDQGRDPWFKRHLHGDRLFI